MFIADSDLESCLYDRFHESAGPKAVTPERSLDAAPACANPFLERRASRRTVTRERLIEIDVGSAASSAELHHKLQEALHFPDWYGCNWDAFWDAITGLVEMPETLRLVGWASLARHLPRDAWQLQRALGDMMKEDPKQAPRVIYA